jgi:Bacterial Ig-like domain
MVPVPRHLARPAACLAAAIGGMLAVTSTAAAIDPPGLTSSPPPGLSQSTSWSFSWSVPAPDPGFELVGVEGGLDGAADLLSSPTTLTVPQGPHTFTVRAVQRETADPANVQRSADASVSFQVDSVAPQLAVGLQGTPSASGWYRALVITRPTCVDPDPGSGLPPGACVPTAWTTPGEGLTPSFSVTDLAGNSTTVAAGPFSFDNVPPTAGEPSEPGPSALVAAEPTFKWTPGDDDLSGVDRYQLQIRSIEDDADAAFQILAEVKHTSGQGDYSARRDPDLMGEPLPEREQLEWRVRTIDRAGNVRSFTPSRRLVIDSTIPAAPRITGGPLGPTRINSPTFSWEGEHDQFQWDLTRAGQELPVRVGSGAATNVTLAQLPDGDYTFRVRQVTGAGQPSAEATRAFKVDTVAPAPPTITVRPPFPTTGPATFGWTMEPGAYSRWEVVGAGGATVLGPSDTPAPGVTLSTLPEGAFSFTVLQVDPAGNVSGTTVEPFTVIAPVLPPPPGAGTSSLVRNLPRQNALRLRPKAGRTVPTRRPVLRWKKGPRGTTLYNLQIFRVSKRTRATGTPIITKIYSAFPRGRQHRAPKVKMTPGTCYVWRVWPYTGRTFTPKPLGISNFCVASRKVLLKKAQEKRARARRAAIRAAAR